MSQIFVVWKSNFVKLINCNHQIWRHQIWFIYGIDNSWTKERSDASSIIHFHLNAKEEISTICTNLYHTELSQALIKHLYHQIFLPASISVKQTYWKGNPHTSCSFFLLPLDSIGKRLSMENNLETIISIMKLIFFSFLKEKRSNHATWNIIE